ncbi:hypothetical protein DPMN_138330 [Dreissena polymorpha]|uniref:Uncharacterized protein n=1 Tax=Dreissena polymorpha TaxID=45954 RepID=A0A9D4G3Q1_DREPO|nr:hypothetical protein DPMN_138330 [Dreissena polymorpha]
MTKKSSTSWRIGDGVRLTTSRSQIAEEDIKVVGATVVNLLKRQTLKIILNHAQEKHFSAYLLST